MWLDYVNTAFTGIGVTAAVAAGFYAARAFGRERARDEQREQDQREAQASLSAAWQVTPRSGDVRDVLDKTFAFVRNASQLPVTNVALEWTHQTRRVYAVTYIGVVPPRASPLIVKPTDQAIETCVGYFSDGQEPAPRSRRGRREPPLHRRRQHRLASAFGGSLAQR